MSNTIDISFIIPVSNKAPVLPAVIENLSKQVGHWKGEYIFIDDASIDNSVQVIRDNIRKFNLKNAQVIEHNHQKGFAVRMNQGILKARGDFLFFMDAGDILAKDAVHHLYERLIISGADMARGLFTLSPQKPEQLTDFELQYPIHCFVSTHPLGTLLTQKHIKRLGILARYDAVLKSGGCDSSLYMNDISLTLNLARVSKKMVVINQPIFKVSRHYPLYRTTPKNKFKVLHDIFMAYYRFIKFETPYPDEYDLALEHAFKYGMQYIADVAENPYNLLPFNRYSVYYALARLFPSQKKRAVNSFANFIKKDKRRWQKDIEFEQIKIIPVYEDDIPSIELYFNQINKGIDPLSSIEMGIYKAQDFVKKHLSPEMNSIFIKAVYKKEIIGLCLLKKIDLSKTYSIYLSILPSFRDRGIGSLLMKTGLKIAQDKNIKHIKTHISIRDKRSLAFFRKNDFQSNRKINQYISDTNKVYKTYLMYLDFE